MDCIGAVVLAVTVAVAFAVEVALALARVNVFWSLRIDPTKVRGAEPLAVAAPAQSVVAADLMVADIVVVVVAMVLPLTAEALHFPATAEILTLLDTQFPQQFEVANLMHPQSANSRQD